RAVDQARDVAPTHCVKTGERTDRATHVWATALPLVGGTLARALAAILRRPAVRVVLPVSDAAWRRWRRPLGRAVAVIGLGLGFVAIGAIGGEPGGVVFGLVLAAVGCWLRLRAWQLRWVGLTLRPDTGDIQVSRVHPAFADEARRIYIDSVQRGH
ncbi:MAG: hypothetical protein Q8K58_02095, partial [Acidimicrobiales bacterium]|nr:hypothetical protein [Acidimicrobiales bacterium]